MMWSSGRGCGPLEAVLDEGRGDVASLLLSAHLGFGLDINILGALGILTPTLVLLRKSEPLNLVEIVPAEVGGDVVNILISAHLYFRPDVDSPKLSRMLILTLILLRMSDSFTVISKTTETLWKSHISMARLPTLGNITKTSRAMYYIIRSLWFYTFKARRPVEVEIPNRDPVAQFPRNFQMKAVRCIHYQLITMKAERCIHYQLIT